MHGKARVGRPPGKNVASSRTVFRCITGSCSAVPFPLAPSSCRETFSRFLAHSERYPGSLPAPLAFSTDQTNGDGIDSVRIRFTSIAVYVLRCDTLPKCLERAMYQIGQSTPISGCAWCQIFTFRSNAEFIIAFLARFSLCLVFLLGANTSRNNNTAVCLACPLRTPCLLRHISDYLPSFPVGWGRF